MAKTKKFTSAPGPTEIANWQTQIPKVGGTVTGSPGDLPTGASPEAVYLYGLDNQQRSLVASSLKKAGYKVPTDGSFGPRLLSAYMDAIGKAQSQAFTLGQEFDPEKDLGKYLSQAVAEQEALGVGSAGGITTYREQVNLRPESINATIDAVFTDLLGRAASDAEKARYLKRIQKKMAQTENMATTQIQTAGGVQQRISTPGFSAEQYLINEVSGTDEAKAQQVAGYYDAFKRALGVM